MNIFKDKRFWEICRILYRYDGQLYNKPDWKLGSWQITVKYVSQEIAKAKDKDRRLSFMLARLRERVQRLTAKVQRFANFQTFESGYNVNGETEKSTKYKQSVKSGKHKRRMRVMQQTGHYYTLAQS